MGAKRGRLEGTFTLSGSATITFDDAVSVPLGCKWVCELDGREYTLAELIGFISKEPRDGR